MKEKRHKHTGPQRERERKRRGRDRDTEETSLPCSTMKGKGFSWMIAVAAAAPPPPLAPSSSSTKLTRVAKQSTVGTARSIHTETQAAMHKTPSLDCWLQLPIVQPSPPSSSIPTFLSSCSFPKQRVSTSVVVSSCVDWLWVANASGATPKRKAKRRSYLQHQIFLLLRKAPNLCFFSNTPPHPRSKKERNKQASNLLMGAIVQLGETCWTLCSQEEVKKGCYYNWVTRDLSDTPRSFCKTKFGVLILNRTCDNDDDD